MLMKPSIFFVLSTLCFILACTKEDEVLPSNLFERLTDPVFESELNIAADPSIVRSGDTLFMYYSAENFKIGVVYSLDDGDTWESPDGNRADDYAALSGQSDKWDSTLETIDVLKVGNTYRMYYAGYREGEADNDHVDNYEIGLAVSTDGINFTRHPESVEKAILPRDVSDEDSNDRHAMTSPGVVYHDNKYYMIYAGWNVTDDWTGSNAGIRIMGATSEDGVSWTKISKPIIIPSEVTYSPDINEATLLRSDDGFWYIVFSTDISIGIARAIDFTGSYDIYPETIISPASTWDSEVTAPDAIIENNKMRIWFHGVKAPAYYPWVIGYSEANYPLDWD